MFNRFALGTDGEGTGTRCYGGAEMNFMLLHLSQAPDRGWAEVEHVVW